MVKYKDLSVVLTKYNLDQIPFRVEVIRRMKKDMSIIFYIKHSFDSLRRRNLYFDESVNVIDV